MKPIYVVLAGLGLLLVGVLWYFFLWTPTQEEIDDIRAQTTQELVQAQNLRTRAAELRDVRNRAPEIEAELAEIGTLVPDEVGLPAILRQVELMAADAGVALESLAPTRPSPVPDADVGFSAIDLSFVAEGTYFQLVDLARRLEDPALVGRGVTWRLGTLASAGEPPNLRGTLGATVYTRSVPTGEIDTGAVAPDVDSGDVDAPPPPANGEADEEIIS